MYEQYALFPVFVEEEEEEEVQSVRDILGDRYWWNEVRLLVFEFASSMSQFFAGARRRIVSASTVIRWWHSRTVIDGLIFCPFLLRFDTGDLQLVFYCWSIPSKNDGKDNNQYWYINPTFWWQFKYDKQVVQELVPEKIFIGYSLNKF